MTICIAELSIMKTSVEISVRKTIYMVAISIMDTICLVDITIITTI